MRWTILDLKASVYSVIVRLLSASCYAAPDTARSGSNEVTTILTQGVAAESLECIAFAAQHDLEHWHEDQRDVFWAMDRALRRGDHGFGQPMKFCWWDDSCWAKIADAPRGSVQSEPYIRAQFTGER